MRHLLIETNNVVHITKKAILIKYEGTEKWLPKSQILYSIRNNGRLNALVPDWLFEVRNMGRACGFDCQFDPYGH